LRKHGLLRTPNEQRDHLLLNAPRSTIEDTIYSTGMKRALRAALALDSGTRDLELCFRSGENAELDLILDGKQLLINDKWMSFHKSHACDPSFCPLRKQASGGSVQIDTFTCGHIVEALYGLILDEISRGSKAESRARLETKHSLRLKVSEKIVQTPHKVESSSCNPGEIQVSWVDPERHSTWEVHRVICEGRVTLHRVSTCEGKRGDLIASCKSMNTSALLDSYVQANGTAAISVLEALESLLELDAATLCGCPSKSVPLKDIMVVFEGLDHDEEYFPMVSAADNQAFYSLPPPPVRPAAPLPESRGSSRASFEPSSPEQLSPLTQKSSLPYLSPPETQKKDCSCLGNDFDQDIYDDQDNYDDDDDGNFGGTTYSDVNSPIHDAQNRTPKATNSPIEASGNASGQSPVS